MTFARRRLLAGPDLCWGHCHPNSKSTNISISSNSQLCEPYLNGAANMSGICWPAIPATGKWYWEFVVQSGSLLFVGISNGSLPTTLYPGGDANSWAYCSSNGQKYTSNSGTAFGATWTTGDVIGVAYDADAGNLYFYKNGSLQGGGAAFTGIASGVKYAVYGQAAGGTAGTLTFKTASFGTYACAQLPSGYSYLNSFAAGKVLCQWNPSDKNASNTLNFQNRSSTLAAGATRATRGVAAGKWYWEVCLSYDDGSHGHIGVANATMSLANYPGQDANGWSYNGNGNKYNNGGSAYGATFGLNDVIGVALDMDGGTITFYKNNVSQGQAFSGLSGTLYPAIGYPGAGSAAAFAFFHRSQQVYTPPAGYNPIGGG